MKAKDYYTGQESYKSHDEKYLFGKSYLDDLFDEDIVRLFSKKIRPNNKTLEVGSFTGRISKKLEKLNIIFDQCDVHQEPLYKSSESNTYFQLNLSLELPLEVKNLKYDVIICIGHQVSFSNDLNSAIQNFYQLLNDGGILVFDVWQKSSTNPLPDYEIQKCSRNEVSNNLQENSFNVKGIIHGQTLFYHFNNIAKNYFFARMLRSKNLTKMYYLMDRYFFSKINKLNKKAQNIYFIAEKF
jgi:SAM-dependent methyltransferase